MKVLGNKYVVCGISAIGGALVAPSLRNVLDRFIPPPSTDMGASVNSKGETTSYVRNDTWFYYIEYGSIMGVTAGVIAVVLTAVAGAAPKAP